MDSRGFLPGTAPYALLTAVTTAIIVTSCVTFVALVSFEVFRSLKLARLDALARDMEIQVMVLAVSLPAHTQRVTALQFAMCSLAPRSTLPHPCIEDVIVFVGACCDYRCHCAFIPFKHLLHCYQRNEAAKVSFSETFAPLLSYQRAEEGVCLFPLETLAPLLSCQRAEEGDCLFPSKHLLRCYRISALKKAFVSSTRHTCSIAIMSAR